jgi:hypothetical protein
MKPFNIRYNNLLERELILEKIKEINPKYVYLHAYPKGRIFLTNLNSGGFVNEHPNYKARESSWNSMDCKEFLKYDITTVS